MMRSAPLVLLLGVLSFSSASAQVNLLTDADRFELGQRLRAFEAALENQKDVPLRLKVIKTLKPVTGLFFTGQLGEVARLLDVARLTLITGKEPEAKLLQAQALSIRPARVFLDSAATELAFSVRSFYQPPGDRPPGLQVRVQVVSSQGKILAGPVVIDLDDLPKEGTIPLCKVIEGDHVFRAEVLLKREGSSEQVALWEQTLSIAADTDARLGNLRQALGKLEDNKGLDGESLRRLSKILANLAEGKSQETPFPAASLLKEAEEGVQMVGKGKPFYGHKKVGQFWLQVPLRPKPVSLRLQAPAAAAKGEPLPLVISLHGAGGSENMFFDGYGNGLIARLCADRGWLLIAPTNTTPTPALLDEVGKLYPIDREKVFVVGHSMGAAQAVQAAQASPEQFLAVAALGGGRGVRASAALKNVAFFIGCGSEDFALGGARGMADSLKKAAIAQVTFREYEGLEHLVIVQLALRDVFAFFDQHKSRK
jgi:predicted esterase